jgi:hypothetical protein
MESLYPHIRALMEAEGFAHVVATYFAAHPPRRESIDEAGEEFPEVLRAARLRYGFGVPLRRFADLAALEHARRAVAAAPDEGAAESCGPARLAELPAAHWAELRVRLRADARAFAAEWDVVEAARQLAAGETPPRPRRRATGVRVWRRPTGEVVARAIPADEARLEAALRAGAGFAEACRQGGIDTDDDAGIERACRYLLAWASEGSVIRISACGSGGRSSDAEPKRWGL